MYHDYFLIGGTNAGVMEHVGDACANHGSFGSTGSQISLLGFASWGVINGKETLINCVSVHSLVYSEFFSIIVIKLTHTNLVETIVFQTLWNLNPQPFCFLGDIPDDIILIVWSYM